MPQSVTVIITDLPEDRHGAQIAPCLPDQREGGCLDVV
jgi:hypothetical protein